MFKLLVTIFLGPLGIHKFMEKKYGLGILYFFTFGLFGIGWLIDIFLAAKAFLVGTIPRKQDCISATETYYKSEEIQAPERPRNILKKTEKILKNESPAQTVVFFDFETTSLSVKTTEIIEIAALKVSNGKVIQEFNTFVKPQYKMDPRALEVNGITAELLRDAPDAKAVLKKFIDFIGTSTLIGHNIASFDMPIFFRYSKQFFDYTPGNPYIDTLSLAQNRLPELPNHRLSTIASYFAIDTTNAHRALADCYITKKVYDELIKLPIPIANKPKQPHQFRTIHNDETKALQELQAFLLGVIADNKLTEAEIFSLKNWLDRHASLAGNYPFDKVFSTIEAALADGILTQSELKEMLDLFKKISSPLDAIAAPAENLDFKDKIVCLSGNFKTGEKSYVESLISKAGGICKSSVTQKTNYVIVGSKGSADWSCGNYGAKIKRVFELQDQGKDIQILKEDDLIGFFKSLK